jgi:two-component system phosphate regulon sensor histidine kinase PhoR
VVQRPRNLQRLGYRRIVQLLVYLVIIPTVLLLALGILLMFLGEVGLNLLLGILTVSFVAVVATGVILVIVFVRREANLSELQADFVSKVSHELRTPLTAIRLFAETLQRSSGDPSTTTKCLDMLNTEIERLTRRIERLLDWGRMEAGRKLYDLREETVQQVVDDAVAAFPPARMGEDVGPSIQLSVDVSPDLPRVTADRHAMADAIVNLLSNAQKYGGTPPTVRLSAHLTPKGDVSIDVSDNGGGIPHVEHRRIFDKFYRIDDRLSRRREGSGLGLAIVKHIVRAHGGRITLDSASGQGSRFSIVLPAHQAGAGAPRDAARPAAEIELQGDGASYERAARANHGR